MHRHEARAQGIAQQPTVPHRWGLLSEAIASLQAFFPHPHQSSTSVPRMEQHGALPTVKEDLPNGEEFGRQPQVQQQQQSRPGATAQPGGCAMPGRRPLFRS